MKRHTEVPSDSSDFEQTSDRTSRVIDIEPAPGLVFDLRTGSGDVRVTRATTPCVQVRLTTTDPNPEERLAQVSCDYDAGSARVGIDTNLVRTTSVPGTGLRRTLMRWVDAVRHDVDVELVVGIDISVVLRTAAGDLVACRDLVDVDVASASGNVELETVLGALTVRTASGNLRALDVRGVLGAKTVSGDVRVQRTSGPLSVQSVSGDVDICAAGLQEARINTVSGDVRVAVSPGLVVDVDATTVSGDLSSDITLDANAQPGVTTESLRLTVRTVSGDVALVRG